MTLDEALNALDRMLAVNGLRFFLTVGKEGFLGPSVVLIVPRGEKLRVGINGKLREMSGLQLYALAEMVAAKFTGHYNYPVDIEWSEV
jgi:hypothetical protein